MNKYAGKFEAKCLSSLWWAWRQQTCSGLEQAVTLSSLKEEYALRKYRVFDGSNKTFSMFTLMMSPLKYCDNIGIFYNEFEKTVSCAKGKGRRGLSSSIIEEESGASDSSSHSSSSSGSNSSDSSDSNSSDSSDSDGSSDSDDDSDKDKSKGKTLGNKGKTKGKAKKDSNKRRVSKSQVPKAAGRKLSVRKSSEAKAIYSAESAKPRDSMLSSSVIHALAKPTPPVGMKAKTTGNDSKNVKGKGKKPDNNKNVPIRRELNRKTALLSIVDDNNAANEAKV
jgi:hypothetical protein